MDQDNVTQIDFTSVAATAPTNTFTYIGDPVSNQSCYIQPSYPWVNPAPVTPTYVYYNWPAVDPRIDAVQAKVALLEEKLDKLMKHLGVA